MPLLNFQKRFAEDVRTGRKRQTIRAYRRDGRDPVPGDILYLWTGLRTKSYEKLGEVQCARVVSIRMSETGVYLCPDRLADWIRLNPRELVELATADGFDGWDAFRNFFRETHGPVFVGLLIQWDDAPVPSLPK